ncbi:DNA gyrase inhibitor YacG [Aquincola sp. MAHUQ-54]|uniref:DNA gyrase inhibitor YacG n=1 Tax=Aquincola agrisoli TaxID=3119538 RepID=A0AAW9QIF9_9BURK
MTTGNSAPAGRTVKCPGCGGPSLFSPENRWRPFCSERCRTADLGAWAEDRYRVAAASQDTESPPPDPQRLGPDGH